MKQTLLEGQTVNGLTALRPEPADQQQFWLFRCVCGNETRMFKYRVLDGRNKSCGCLNGKRSAYGGVRPQHGESGSRLHNIWRGMLKRVDATKGHAFEKYASRGIGVDPLWRQYEPFRDWALASGYAADLTLDRQNNDGDYGPDNCRWVGWAAQARNRRSSRYVAAFGVTLTLAEWGERSGVKAETISARLALNWTAEDAVSKPVRR